MQSEVKHFSSNSPNASRHALSIRCISSCQQSTHWWHLPSQPSPLILIHVSNSTPILSRRKTPVCRILVETSATNSSERLSAAGLVLLRRSALRVWEPSPGRASRGTVGAVEPGLVLFIHMRRAGGSLENLQEPQGVLQLTWTFKTYSLHMRLAERKWEIDEEDTQKDLQESTRETGAFTSQLDPEDTVILQDFSFITKETYSNRAPSINFVNCWK